MSRHRMRTLVAMGMAAAMLAGCAAGGSTQGRASSGRPSPAPTVGTAPQAPAQDKAGTQTLTLHIATPDVVNNNGMSYGTEAFINDLASVSGGRIKVDVLEHYGGDTADAETRIIQALASGEIDGGWPSARSFANAGIPALQALESPMTITSIAAEKALLSGRASTDALAALHDTGLVGLSLLVGPLRRPFAARAPLLEPADWQGATFRTFDSSLQGSAIAALGGTPVVAGSDWPDKVAAGELRGIEFDIAQYDVNDKIDSPLFVTANEVLWPKVFVLAMSQKRWDLLNDQQKAWVQQAADMARQASLDGSYDESGAAQRLCGANVRFVDASQAQLAAMRATLAPVIARLAADPSTSRLMADVQAAAAQHPGIDEPSVPDDCRSPSLVALAPSIPSTASSLPNGTYRMRVTAADAEASGLSPEQGNPGTWTLTVKDGTFALSCRFVSDPVHDCGNSHFDGATVEAGRLFGTGQTVYFVGDAVMLQHANGCVMPVSQQDGHCFVIPPYWLTWSLSGGRLTFSDPGGDQDARQYLLQPWTRIS